MIKVTRFPDWQARLTEFLMQVSRLPFLPGTNDCALFAAGAVDAMTGVDLAAEFRGTYRRLSDGQAALVERGFADHVDFVAHHFEQVPPSLAQVGDLALVPQDGEGPGALGVVQGPGVYVLTLSGLAVVDRLQMISGFKL